jgi:hypothetical protein
VEEKSPTHAYGASDGIEKQVSASRGNGLVAAYRGQAGAQEGGIVSTPSRALSSNSVSESELPPDYLEQTRLFWQPYSDRPLTREDARDMAHNLIGFFTVLREWIIEERRNGRRGGVAPQAPSPLKRGKHKKPSAEAKLST